MEKRSETKKMIVEQFIRIKKEILNHAIVKNLKNEEMSNMQPQTISQRRRRILL